MADISTTVAGIKMRSPIGAPSLAPVNWWYPAGPMEKIVDWHKRCIDHGAGFVYTPSCLPGEESQPIRQSKIGQYVGYGERKRHGYYLCCPEEVNQALSTDVSKMTADPDIQAFTRREFYYAVTLCDDRGFFILDVPRNQKVKLYAFADNHRTMVRNFTSKEGISQNLGKIIVFKY